MSYHLPSHKAILKRGNLTLLGVVTNLREATPYFLCVFLCCKDGHGGARHLTEWHGWDGLGGARMGLAWNG
jgi:hypothetical protein